MHGTGQNKSHWQKPINQLQTAPIHLVMARSVPRPLTSSLVIYTARLLNEAKLSHGGALQARGPINCGIVYVICDSGKTTLDPSTH